MWKVENSGLWDKRLKSAVDDIVKVLYVMANIEILTL